MDALGQHQADHAAVVDDLQAQADVEQARQLGQQRGAVDQGVGIIGSGAQRAFIAGQRFVVQDGEPDRALLDASWHGYASPAQPQLGRP